MNFRAGIIDIPVPRLADRVLHAKVALVCLVGSRIFTVTKSDKIIDISQQLRPTLPVWPGDTPFSIEAAWSMGPECRVHVSRLHMSSQTGTHADAHSHFETDGDDIANTSLDAFLGHCELVHVNADGGVITVDEVLPKLKDPGPERVLLKTFRRFPRDHWPGYFRAISAELIDALGAKGCRLIGTDAPSIDPQDSKTMDAHHAVHRQNMAILEGLVLDDVAPGMFELIALPIAIEGADASPVRAVLRPLASDRSKIRYD